MYDEHASADAGAMDHDLDDVEIIEPEDLEQEDVTEYRPSMRSRVISVLTTILQTNLVWYVAGLVDGLILLKLFGG